MGGGHQGERFSLNRRAFQDRQLATALDVEGDGRASAGLRHGCTSLILQQAGTTTTMRECPGRHRLTSKAAHCSPVWLNLCRPLKQCASVS